MIDMGKIKDYFELNPSKNTNNYTDYINYIDTSSVTKGILYDITYLDGNFPSRANRRVKYDDILYSSVRPNLRHYYHYKLNYENVVASTGFVLLRNKNKELYSSEFLYYFLGTDSVVTYLSNIAELSQSTFPSFSAKDLGKIELPAFDFIEQEKIADILTTYDNLIENNNKRIKILEQMAENLYKEWFVRFRFPGYEDTEFEDGMPRGWVREKIGLHYNTCSGGTPSRTHEEYYTEGTIPWVKTGEIKDGIIIHTDECITEAGIKGSSAKLLPQGAVVMAMYGVNIGMLAYLDSEMTCNQACCVFNDKNEINSRHYLFHYLYSIRDYLLLIGFGAAQQNLSQDLIKKVKIVIPTAELIKEFDKQKEPLYQTIRALMMQNDKLIKQRDALLPRLMSGKLEV